jgi:hypothetical protein
MAFSLNLAPIAPISTALGGNYSVGIFTADGVNWQAVLVPTSTLTQVFGSGGIGGVWAWNGTGATPDAAVSAACFAMQAAMTTVTAGQVAAGNAAAAQIAAINAAIAKGT